MTDTETQCYPYYNFSVVVTALYVAACIVCTSVLIFAERRNAVIDKRLLARMALFDITSWCSVGGWLVTSGIYPKQLAVVKGSQTACAWWTQWLPSVFGDAAFATLQLLYMVELGYRSQKHMRAL